MSASQPRLRLLVFNWRDVRHPRAGGAEKYLHAMARRWIANGHSVAWIAAGFRGCAREEVVDGVRLVRAGNAVTVYLCAAVTYLRQFRGRVDRVIDAENGIPFFTPLFVREPILALIFHVHVRVFRSQLPWPIAAFFVWVETRLVPKLYAGRRYVTISNTSRDEMRAYRLTAGPIPIVHPGVDAFASARPRSLAPRIAYVGRLEPYKRVDVVIRLAGRLAADYPDLVLDVVGAGSDRPRLEHLARELAIFGRVRFHGFVDDAAKADVLAESWALATASSMEGWGIVAIEANALGTPAVVFDVPGLSEAVRDGQSGFVAADEVAFEACLRRILDDPALRARLEAGARARAADFGWDAAARAFLEVLVGDETRVPLVTVGIPVFDEEANLDALLGRLEAEPAVERIVAVDDGSTDGSLAILRAHANRAANGGAPVVPLSTGGRAGQLRGWRIAAGAATTDRIVFIDGDALPERGAVEKLVRAACDGGAVIASGRVVPDPLSARVPISRFSASVLHRVRALGFAKEAVIGRFFCVDAAWFRATATRDDVVANDTYLSVRARRAGLGVAYVPDARCRYAGAVTVADLAAQRQRADAGYAQLRAEGLLLPADEPPARAYAKALLVAALGDPVGAVAWGIAQLRARGLRAYRVRSHAGTWTTQASTKRAIPSDGPDGA